MDGVDLPEDEITEEMERNWRDQTISRSNLMEQMDPVTRDRLIATSANVVDLREYFRREQESAA